MRIGIHGAYQTPNYGDLLLMELVSDHVRRAGHEVVCPWLPTRFRDELATPGGGGLRDCFGLNAAIFGGGGYFNDDGSRISRRRMLRYSVPAMIWRWTPTPYIVVGVGAGPTLGPSTRRRVRYICQGARQVCVRDAATRELLVEAGVSAGDMLITADLAIAIEREHIPAEALRHAQRFLGPRIEGRRRLCLHPPLMPEQREQSFELMRGLGARLRGQTQIQVFWLYDGGGVSLEEFQRTAAEALPESRVLQIEAPWKTTAVLGEMDAVLTTKLHVGIVAWALGVMPCSLSKHGKTVRFYQQIDRGAFQADYTTSPRAYEAWLDCLLNDPQRYYADDPQVRARVKAHAAKNFEQIDAFLEQISRTPS